MKVPHIALLGNLLQVKWLDSDSTVLSGENLSTCTIAREAVPHLTASELLKQALTMEML
ncbi:hypothetical protein V5F32_00290 [Xanthobacter oligotrophicus]|uniref:Uncharacterized protein n=1 Tax=Xanthobacter oligotrophicus TaxID=2607286 RepID=A0ABW6ZS57_9HYPH